jgi:hypothetical protein
MATSTSSGVGGWSSLSNDAIVIIFHHLDLTSNLHLSITCRSLIEIASLADASPARLSIPAAPFRYMTTRESSSHSNWSSHQKVGDYDWLKVIRLVKRLPSSKLRLLVLPSSMVDQIASLTSVNTNLRSLTMMMSSWQPSSSWSALANSLTCLNIMLVHDRGGQPSNYWGYDQLVGLSTLHQLQILHVPMLPLIPSMPSKSRHSHQLHEIVGQRQKGSSIHEWLPISLLDLEFKYVDTDESHGLNALSRLTNLTRLWCAPHENYGRSIESRIEGASSLGRFCVGPLSSLRSLSVPSLDYIYDQLNDDKWPSLLTELCLGSSWSRHHWHDDDIRTRLESLSSLTTLRHLHWSSSLSFSPSISWSHLTRLTLRFVEWPHSIPSISTSDSSSNSSVRRQMTSFDTPSSRGARKVVSISSRSILLASSSSSSSLVMSIFPTSLLHLSFRHCTHVPISSIFHLTLLTSLRMRHLPSDHERRQWWQSMKLPRLKRLILDGTCLSRGDTLFVDIITLAPHLTTLNIGDAVLHEIKHTNISLCWMPLLQLKSLRSLKCMWPLGSSSNSVVEGKIMDTVTDGIDVLIQMVHLQRLTLRLDGNIVRSPNSSSWFDPLRACGCSVRLI